VYPRPCPCHRRTPGAAHILADASSPGIEGRANRSLTASLPGRRRLFWQDNLFFESGIAGGPDGNHEAHGRTTALINKPVDDCFKIFCEVDKHYLYLPRTTVSRVLKRECNTIVIYKELDYGSLPSGTRTSSPLIPRHIG